MYKRTWNLRIRATTTKINRHMCLYGHKTANTHTNTELCFHLGMFALWRFEVLKYIFTS